MFLGVSGSPAQRHRHARESAVVANFECSGGSASPSPVCVRNCRESRSFDCVGPHSQCWESASRRRKWVPSMIIEWGQCSPRTWAVSRPSLPSTDVDTRDERRLLAGGRARGRRPRGRLVWHSLHRRARPSRARRLQPRHRGRSLVARSAFTGRRVGPPLGCDTEDADGHRGDEDADEAAAQCCHRSASDRGSDGSGRQWRSEQTTEAQSTGDPQQRPATPVVSRVVVCGCPGHLRHRFGFGCWLVVSQASQGR